MRARSALALGCGVAFLVGSTPASAYVRTLTSRGNPTWWGGSCVFMTPHADGSDDLGDGSELTALRAAADEWNAVPCSYVRFAVQAPDPEVEMGFDNRGRNTNIVVFREVVWTHDPVAAALTTLTFVKDEDDPLKDGELLDADVEINGVDFQWTTSGDPARHDLQNILTHELGHVLGLDHTCDDGTLPYDPVDQTGTPIPDCAPANLLPPSVLEATMYNFAPVGELEKRTLHQDDIDGLCAVYPLADDPGRCKRVDLRNKGCQSSGGAGGLPWLLLGLALFARRRRLHWS